jgi:branched-chain amino acid aminotransferase
MALIPFDDRDGTIWMDGEMMDWRDAKVHFLTHALHYGTQVFEGERAYNNTIFKNDQHSARLKNSAEVIYMDFDMDLDELSAMKNELIKKNGLENAYIRAAAWRGSEQMGIDVGETKTHMAIAAWDWGSYFDSEARDRGISLMTSKWAKPAPNTAPTNSKTASLYNLSAMAKLEAKKSGYTDAFMMDHEGFIAESSGANIFFVKDGALHTPTADRFLNGITRQTVIGLAKDRGIEVVERRMMPEEIKDVQEVFLTGTAAEVTAVGKIDDTQYQVGQVTRQLRDDYESLVRS